MNPDGSAQRSRWPWPSPTGAWLEAVGLADRRSDAWLVGAVLLLNQRAVQEVGGFDERFFLYAEETDWQRRAALAGWACGRLTTCGYARRGRHQHGWRRRELQFHAGQETYIRKWFGFGGWQAYRAAVVLGAPARAVVRSDGTAQRALMYLRGPRRLARRDGHLPATSP